MNGIVTSNAAYCGTRFAEHVVSYYNERFENGRIEMSEEENSTGNNLIWAVTLIIVVALIAGALYYSGFLGGAKRQTQKIDVEVSAPAR